MTAHAKVRVAFTLTPDARHGAGRAELLARLKAVGVEDISEGRATVSGLIESDELRIAVTFPAAHGEPGPG